MNVDAAQRIVDRHRHQGRGSSSDGIDPDNPDLIRPDGQHVIFDYQDFSGDGTAAAHRRPGGLLERGPHRLAGQSGLRPVEVRQPGAPAAAWLQHQDRGHRPRRERGGAGRRSATTPRCSTPTSSRRSSTRSWWTTSTCWIESFEGNPIPNTENDPVGAGRPGGGGRGRGSGRFHRRQWRRRQQHRARLADIPGVIGVGAHHRLPDVPPDRYERTEPGSWRLGERQHQRAELRAASTSSTRPPWTWSLPPTASGSLCSTDTASVLRLHRSGQRVLAGDLDQIHHRRDRPPRSPPSQHWSRRRTRRRTMAHCRPLPWSRRSSSARPPTWARRPITRAPGWSTRSRPCSSPSPSAAPARRAARCW